LEIFEKWVVSCGCHKNGRTIELHERFLLLDVTALFTNISKKLVMRGEGVKIDGTTFTGIHV